MKGFFHGHAATLAVCAGAGILALGVALISMPWGLIVGGAELMVLGMVSLLGGDET